MLLWCVYIYMCVFVHSFPCVWIKIDIWFFSPSQCCFVVDRFLLFFFLVFHYSLFVHIIRIWWNFLREKNISRSSSLWMAIIAATHSNSLLLHSFYFHFNWNLFSSYNFFFHLLSTVAEPSSLSIHCDGNAHTQI